MAKDRTPATGKGRPAARGGRTRPPTQVVSQQRPWGLIVGAVVVALFAAAVLGYAVVKVNKADAEKIDSVDKIAGIKSFDYAAGQDHVTTPVTYDQSPPVGGPHAPPPDWADCTGTVYDIDVRHENAVHSLEHGAVWITYNPDEVSDADVTKLADLIDGVNGRMLSPYAGLDSPISIQSWNHQLKVDSAGDKRIKQFADLLTLNSEFTPEPGASCVNPGFISNPVPEEPNPAGSDGAATPSSQAPAGTTAP